MFLMTSSCGADGAEIGPPRFASTKIAATSIHVVAALA
jgi:hypothetical protein